MENRKILSALCYFSILFAGFLFPLVVFFVSEDSVTKGHAKKALFSHLIPLILVPIIGISFFFDIRRMGDGVPVLTLVTVALMMLVSFVVLIWNIVKGVKVLRDE